MAVPWRKGSIMPGIILDTKFDSKRWSNKVIGIMKNELKGSLLQAVLFVETKVAEKTPVGVTGELRTGITGKVISSVRGVVSKRKGGESNS